MAKRRSGGAAARLALAAAKAAGAIESARSSEADVVADGVRAVAREIVNEIEPGALYWRAPLQYIAEQAAPRVATQFHVPAGEIDELRAYLLSGMNEFLVALVGDLDRSHYEAWVAAFRATEGAPAPE